MKYLPLILCLSLPLTAAAQRRYTHRAETLTPAARTAQQYTDSLRLLSERFATWRNTKADTLSNPYYAALFGASTLYDDVIHRAFALSPGEAEQQTKPSPSEANADIYSVIDATDAALTSAYTLTPWNIRTTQGESLVKNLPSASTPKEQPNVKLTEKLEESKKAEETVLPDEVLATEDWKIVVRKPNFWNYKANFSLQFTQNYVSDNWYKGGESHNSLLGQLNIEANYNNKQKVTFDNKLELKLGFQTSENDEEHKYKTNSDLIRLTNKLGLRAVKNWYYTVMLQSWTQFYPGLRSNDTRVYSDFMSPFESLLSIGMSYTPTIKKFNLTATLSPLALKFKYVDRGYLATSFGLDEGKHTKWDYGSNVTINYRWDIVKNISWQGRIYWFTDYTMTQFEWENTFNFAINRYLSTRLFLYPRFDDNRMRKEGESYWQFNELMSVGLNLSL